jgi:hypothetical protein
MKRFGKYSIFAAVWSLIVLAGMAVDIDAQVKRRPVVRKKTVVRKTVTPAARLYTVSAGQTIRVRMNGTISSKTAAIGNTFTATVTEPVYASGGQVVVPVGSTVVGRVDSVTRARKGGNPGQINVSFTSLRLPNGTSRRINGSLTDLTSDDAKSDAESTASGDRMKHRKLIFIGGGGAGGAILGAAIGGGKGALIGGLLGAGGGFLGEKLTKGEEAEVRSGTEFAVLLNQAISLPRFAEVNP